MLSEALICLKGATKQKLNDIYNSKAQTGRSERQAFGLYMSFGFGLKHRFDLCGYRDVLVQVRCMEAPI